MTGRFKDAVLAGIVAVNRQPTSRFELFQFPNQRDVPGPYLFEHDPPRSKLHRLSMLSCLLRHGRVESRATWTTATLDDYLNFPYVGQPFLFERTVTVQTTGKQTVEYAYGITSHSPNTASAERLLALNRGHWAVEASYHILDCCWDDDRCRFRTGHGLENTTRLQPFAIGVIHSKSHCVAAAARRLNRKLRLVLGYLKMTESTLYPTKLAPSSARTN